MSALLERIRRAVREERYVLGDHADNRLRERGIPHWQIVEGLQKLAEAGDVEALTRVGAVFVRRTA